MESCDWRVKIDEKGVKVRGCSVVAKRVHVGSQCDPSMGLN